jgi:hypothetical protein
MLQPFIDRRIVEIAREEVRLSRLDRKIERLLRGDTPFTEQIATLLQRRDGDFEFLHWSPFHEICHEQKPRALFRH